MSDEKEVVYFNVKNTSLRLVHIGGVSVPPDKVIALVDDLNGINKRDVESSEFLEETDEDIDWPEQREPVKIEPVKKAAKTATTKNTASGAGWNAANKS